MHWQYVWAHCHVGKINLLPARFLSFFKLSRWDCMVDQKLTVLSMFSIQENILTRLFKVSHLIHHSIRPDATDFQSRSFEIWHTSAFSLCFPSLRMAS